MQEFIERSTNEMDANNMIVVHETQAPANVYYDDERFGAPKDEVAISTTLTGEERMDLVMQIEALFKADRKPFWVLFANAFVVKKMQKIFCKMYSQMLFQLRDMYKDPLKISLPGFLPQ